MSAPIHDPLAEILRGNVDLLYHLSRFEPYLANRRVRLEAGTLVQVSAQIEGSLGDCGRAVGIGMSSLHVIDGRRRPRRYGTGDLNRGEGAVEPTSLSDS